MLKIAIAFLLVVLLAALCSCGKTMPTAAVPCTPDRATRVETTYVAIPTGSGGPPRIGAITYHCPPQ